MSTNSGILEMSDEAVLSMVNPPAVEEPPAGGKPSESTQVETPSKDTPETEATSEDTPSGEPDGGNPDDEPDDQAPGDDDDPPESGEKAKETSSEAPEKDGKLDTKDTSQEGTEAGKDKQHPPDAKDQTKDDPKGSKESVASPDAKEPDYKAFYEQVLGKPLKAGGKTIELKSPDEAIQLMQMGADYTRKMQALAPQRKFLLMLENNGLLDEGKLSYLIDLDKKNPEAINKLIKDAGIDPLEIDVNAESTYREGNHRVSDKEAVFVTVVEDLQSSPTGSETLKVFNTWDHASKEVTWNNPDILSLIHTQRESGVYDRISTEIDRRKTLGQIPTNVPFLQAYKQIGDELAASGSFDDLVQAKPPVQTDKTPVPVATQVQKPKPAVKNSDKVNAASQTRSSPKKAESKVNPLSMSDADFEKQFVNR